MVLLTRKRQVAVEVESTEGTAETLADADAAFLAYDPTYDYSPEMHNREPSRKYRGKVKGVVGKIPATLAWRTPVKGSGAVATKPAWNDSLIACGFTAQSVSTCSFDSITGGTFYPMENIVGSVSGATGRIVGEVTASPVRYVLESSTGFSGTADVITGQVSGSTATLNGSVQANQGFEYTPDSDAKSVTAGLYLDGKRNQMRGARGNVTIEATAGAPLMFNFELQGAHESEADAALLSPTYQTPVEPVLESASYSFAGLTECFDALTINSGNVIAERTCPSATNGQKSYRITDWEPQVTIDPEDVLVSTASFKAQLESRATHRFYCQVGSGTGERIGIAAPSMAYNSVGMGDRDGIATALLTFDCLVTDTTDGDDELQIAMW